MKSNPWKATTIGLAMLLGVVVGGSYLAPVAADPQPHMVKALEHLRSAKEELNLATSDKGGHRVKALKAIGVAIEQVEKGIAFDDKH